MPGNRYSLRLDAESAARLDRLAEQHGGEASATMREALKLYELGQAHMADLVRDALLNLAAAIEPDQCYDPAEDPRRTEAVMALAAILGSVPAAEGAAQALTVLWAQQQEQRYGQ
jgi:predicted transcriptional regulator